jgi:hypothetical protein
MAMTPAGLTTATTMMMLTMAHPRSPSPLQVSFSFEAGSRRRMDWDFARMLQSAYTTTCGVGTYYMPISITGDAPLSSDTVRTSPVISAGQSRISCIRVP